MAQMTFAFVQNPRASTLFASLTIQHVWTGNFLVFLCTVLAGLLFLAYRGAAANNFPFAAAEFVVQKGFTSATSAEFV